MTEWFVYQPSGAPIGPVSTDLLARGILQGKVPRDAHVAGVGASQWSSVLGVPEVSEALRVMESSIPPPPSAPLSTIPPAPPPNQAAPLLANLGPALNPVVPRPPVPPRPAAALEATAPSVAPLAAVAPAPAPAAVAAPVPAPVVAPAPAPAAVAVAAPKPAAPVATTAPPATTAAKPAAPAAAAVPKPPVLGPEYDKVPFVIFGACFAVSVVLAIVGLAASPGAPAVAAPANTGAASTAAAK